MGVRYLTLAVKRELLRHDLAVQMPNAAPKALTPNARHEVPKRRFERRSAIQTSRIRPALAPALTLLVLFLLLALPRTHEIVTVQAGMLTAPEPGLAWALRQLGVQTGLPDSDPAEEQQALRAAARRAPNDYLLQLAYALKADWQAERGKSDTRVNRLRALSLRFPDRAALYAHILRIATQAEVHIRREDEREQALTGKAPTYLAAEDSQPSTPQSLAAFDQDAAEGERRDPDNAYFPMMRALGLFAARRDAEAVDALLRAGSKPRWDDYMAEEAEADWRLAVQAFGLRTAILRAAVQAAVPAPHLAELRNLGRMAVYKAAQAEAAGRRAEGLAIRKAALHCGSLMRAQARTENGARVGIAMVTAQLLRPGGAPPVDINPSLTADQQAQQQLQAYTAYLDQIGHPEVATAAKEEIEAGNKALAILDRRAEQGTSPYLQGVARLTTGWAAALLCLANALEMLALAGVVWILVRVRQEKGSVPLMTALFLFTAFFVLAYRAEWGSTLSQVRSAITTTVTNSSEPSTDVTAEDTTDQTASPADVQPLAIGFSLAVPLLSLVALGVAFLARPQPVLPQSSFSLQPYSRLCALVAAGLMLVYAALILTTIRQESSVDQALERDRQHAGRYAAEQVGQSWPDTALR